MFEILKHLRDINALRRVHWHMEAGDSYGHDDAVLIVRIPLTSDDRRFVTDMQALFAPAED